jgi:hypothetical protein
VPVAINWRVLPATTAGVTGVTVNVVRVGSTKNPLHPIDEAKSMSAANAAQNCTVRLVFDMSKKPLMEAKFTRHPAEVAVRIVADDFDSFVPEGQGISTSDNLSNCL